MPGKPGFYLTSLFMHLLNKINFVKLILAEADNHVAEFQRISNIACIANCGLCCTKPDIEATVIEFLPAAYELCISNDYLSIYELIENKSDTTCIFYNAFSNGKFCSQYKTRGLICRLFGFSTAKNKNGEHSLITCKQIKQSTNLNKIHNKLHLAPQMSDYYFKFYGIDSRLSVDYYPINIAIKTAIEIVSIHLLYDKNTA